MRYSKQALLIFGAGCVLGLVVVSVRLPAFARVASVAMAAGIALLPIAVIADWRRRRSTPMPAKRRSRNSTRGKRRTPARPSAKRKR